MTVNDAGMACVVVDGVPAAEVRAALLRSRRCALRARQVLILEEFLIMGTHGVQVLPSGDWSAQSIHGVTCCPAVGEADLLCLALEAQVLQLEVTAGSDTGEAVRDLLNALLLEVRESSKAVGRFPFGRAVERHHWFRAWEQDPVIPRDQPRLEVETYKREVGLGAIPYRHTKSCILVTGAGADQVREALVAGRKLSIPAQAISSMSQFVVAGRTAGSERLIGIARGSAYISRDIMRLMIRLLANWVEWDLVSKFKPTPRHWESLARTGAGRITHSIGTPVQALLDVRLELMKAERTRRESGSTSAAAAVLD